MKRVPTLILQLVLTILGTGVLVLAQDATPPRINRIMCLGKDDFRPDPEFSEDDKKKLRIKCDSFVEDGVVNTFVRVNDFSILVSLVDDGDYITVYTAVVNDSPDRILVDPARSNFIVWKTADRSRPPESFSPISGQQIAKAKLRRVGWINLIGGVVARLATNTTTVDTMSSGSVSVYGSNGSFASGTYSGSSTSTITTPDIFARMQEDVRARERTSQARNDAEYYVQNAFTANTLARDATAPFLKSSASGMIYFKRKKGAVELFTMEINGILFDFMTAGLGPRKTSDAQSGPPKFGEFKPCYLDPNGCPKPNPMATPKSEPPPVATPNQTQTTSPPSNGEPLAKTSSPADLKPNPITNTKPSGIELVWIPAGSFQMGSTDGEKYEKPVRRVVISEGFWMGKYEVTQLQWFTEMGVNSSDFEKCGGACPVENVSWEDAQRFVARLNARNDGFVYSLPTEAQWEYAARAGTTGKWAGDVKEMAWYSDTSNGRTQPVGTKRANAFGLHDMHGNVWEWCEDWYGDYPRSPEADPRGPAKGKYRILRGGSWKDGSGDARSAYRGGLSPSTKYKDIGFRVVARIK